MFQATSVSVDSPFSAGVMSNVCLPCCRNQHTQGTRTAHRLWKPAALLPRVVGNTSRTAFQNPNAPSPTANTGAVIPRRRHDRSRSAHDSVDSR